MEILSSIRQSLSPSPTEQPEFRAGPQSGFFITSTLKHAESEDSPSKSSGLWNWITLPFSFLSTLVSKICSCFTGSSANINRLVQLKEAPEDFAEDYDTDSPAVIGDLAKAFFRDPSDFLDKMGKNPDGYNALMGHIQGACIGELKSIFTDFAAIESPEIAKNLLPTFRKFTADMAEKLKDASPAEGGQNDLEVLKKYFSEDLPRRIEEWEKDAATLVPLWRDFRNRLINTRSFYQPLMYVLGDGLPIAATLNCLANRPDLILSPIPAGLSGKNFNAKLASGFLREVGPVVVKQLLAHTADGDKYRKTVLRAFESQVGSRGQAWAESLEKATTLFDQMVANGAKAKVKPAK